MILHRGMTPWRWLLVAAFAIVLIGLSGCRASTGVMESADSKKELTVVSFGGAYQKAQHNAYMDPFAGETGLTITEGEYDGDYEILKQRASGSQASWDVVSVESGPALRGEREGLFVELPDSVFANTHILPAARRPRAAGHLVFSTVLSYDSEVFPDAASSPKTWMDFWDTKRFPGKRGLRNIPRGTLEIALLADGVKPESLYPLDVQRGLRKLDELKPSLVFWQSGAQPPQLLANKTVVMTSAYNGRVWHAAVNEKLPIKWVFTQGLMEVEYWAIPKNSRNVQLALNFIAFSLRPERQAAFANEIAYGPTNRDAVTFVSPNVMAALPSSDEALPGQIVVNADWWADNEAGVTAIWEHWLQGK